MRKMRRNHGFSLIELIIVIGIMAVLVAILTPQFLKFVSKARVTACDAQREIIMENYTIHLVDERDITKEALLDKVTSTLGLSKEVNGSDTVYAGACPEDDGKYIVEFYPDDSKRIKSIECTHVGHGSLVNPVPSPLPKDDKSGIGLTALRQAFELFRGDDLYKEARGSYLDKSEWSIDSRAPDSSSNYTKYVKPLLEEALKKEGYKMTDTTIWKVCANTINKDTPNEKKIISIYWLDTGEEVKKDGTYTGSQIKIYSDGTISDINNDSKMTIDNKLSGDEYYQWITNRPKD